MTLRLCAAALLATMLVSGPANADTTLKCQVSERLKEFAMGADQGVIYYTIQSNGIQRWEASTRAWVNFCTNASCRYQSTGPVHRTEEVVRTKNGPIRRFLQINTNKNVFSSQHDQACASQGGGGVTVGGQPCGSDTVLKGTCAPSSGPG